MRGLGLIIYGIEGIGKTSFAIQAPKPVGIISIKEAGYDDLDMVGEVPERVNPLICKNWEDVKVAVEAFQGKTLVIDSILGLQDYVSRHVTDECYRGNFTAFNAYRSGIRQDVPRYMNELVDLFEYKRAQGVNIIVIGHRKTETETDTGGADVKVQDIAGDEGVTSSLKKWAQAIIFMDGKKDITTVTKTAGYGNDTKVLEGKSFNKPTRVMYTEYTGFHVAKNKLHLPGLILMGNSAPEAWTNFKSALPEKIQKILVDS